MKVVSIGPDAVALKIASAADHVGSLTPAELQQSHVSADLLSVFERYAKKVSAIVAPADLEKGGSGPSGP